jgi:hypothetical protein
MDGSGRWLCVVSGILLSVLGTGQARAASAAEAVFSGVGAVTARSESPDGSYREEIGNCLLWAFEGRVYTLGDLHTVMTGGEGASGRVADRLEVKVGTRSSRARLVWPPSGRRDVLAVDMAILELADGVAGQPFEPEAFQGAAVDLPGSLFLAAPGHRSRIVPIEARAVRYGSQWFLYRELSPGDSGGMLFARQDGRVIPYGFVSAVGSLPGDPARGTVFWSRSAMRVFIDQFLQAGRMASRLPEP